MARVNFADTEAAYLAKLEAIVAAADEADAPILAQIETLRSQLSAVKDPVVAKARKHYSMLVPHKSRKAAKLSHTS